MVLCVKSTDAHIIAELVVNNEAKVIFIWGLFWDEEYKEVQEKFLRSAAEVMVHVHELRSFFEGQAKIED